MTDTILADPIYTVEVRKWNEQNYPYWDINSRWNNVDSAVADKQSLTGYTTPTARVVKHNLIANEDGRVSFSEVLVVLDEEGVWHSLYDPRANDPDWAEYARLKEKFNDA